MSIRRVVTGHNAEGKAVFASDVVVAPVTSPLVPGAEFYRLWGGDVAGSFPDAGTQPEQPTYFPPVGGFRFGVFTVAPHTTRAAEEFDVGVALETFERDLPGLGAHMEPNNPGMHTTATIDYEYIVSGRCVLELDDGETKELSAGDTVIQNGTRHAWRNPFNEACVLVVCLVGAHHKSRP